MTVKELIEELQKCPPEAPVKIEAKEYGGWVTEINTEFDGRRTFIIITDFGE